MLSVLAVLATLGAIAVFAYRTRATVIAVYPILPHKYEWVVLMRRRELPWGEQAAILVYYYAPFEGLRHDGEKATLMELLAAHRATYKVPTC